MSEQFESEKEQRIREVANFKTKVEELEEKVRVLEDRNVTR